MAKPTGIELAALIRTLREQLGQAVDEGKNDKIRFKLENVELELQVTVGLEAGGNGKIKVWLIEAGAGAKASRDSVQRIKLTLKPDSSWGGQLGAESSQRPR